MAKNSPSETRTSRMAYGSKSLLPSSASWANRFQSTSCPSIGGCAVTIPQMAVSLANSRATRLCVHPFDPLSAPRGSHEWICKVLCFPRNLVVPELHDAQGVSRFAVMGRDELGDQKTPAAN